MNRKELATIILGLFHSDFERLAPLLSRSSGFSVAALEKFQRARSEVKNLCKDDAELYVSRLFDWLRSKRHKPWDKTVSLSALLGEAYSDLSGIIGPEDAKEHLLYLLFFREATSRFLTDESMLLSLRTNSSSFDLVYGASSKQVFEVYEELPGLLALYSASFASSFGIGDQENLKQLGADGETVLDMGGGSGGLGLAMQSAGVSLGRYDLFDLPETEKSLVDSRSMFWEKIKTEKNLVYGNFFRSDLGNEKLLNSSRGMYDTIFLTWILHDWDDEKCLMILKNIRPLLKKGGRIVLIERASDGPTQFTPSLYAFVMLLLAEGYERKFSEYDDLMAKSGFAVGQRYSSEGARDCLVYRQKA